MRKLDSGFGIALTASVEDRIKQRRQVKLSTLIAYLEDPKFLDVGMTFDRVLPYSSKTTITTLTKDVYIRMFYDHEGPADQNVPGENSDGPSTEQSQTVSETEPQPQPPQRRKSQDLRDYKAAKKKRPNSIADSFTTSSTRVKKAIENEMKTFELTGKRPEMLEKASS